MAKNKKYYQVFDNRGKEWTPEEDKLLTQRYKNGIKPAVLAELHGRTVNAVRSRIKKLEVLK